MILSGKITKSVREQDVIAKWHIVNAEGKTLGRLASQVAFLIRGKHKPDFTPHVDCGDFVVVINAAQIKVKGKREEQKEYFHYTDIQVAIAIVLSRILLKASLKKL